MRKRNVEYQFLFNRNSLHKVTGEIPSVLAALKTFIAKFAIQDVNFVKLDKLLELSYY